MLHRTQIIRDERDSIDEPEDGRDDDDDDKGRRCMETMLQLRVYSVKGQEIQVSRRPKGLLKSHCQETGSFEDGFVQ